MTIVRARYYDGKSSASHEVELRLPDSGSDPIRVSGDGIDLTYALARQNGFRSSAGGPPPR